MAFKGILLWVNQTDSNLLFWNWKISSTCIRFSLDWQMVCLMLGILSLYLGTLAALIVWTSHVSQSRKRMETKMIGKSHRGVICHYPSWWYKERTTALPLPTNVSLKVFLIPALLIQHDVWFNMSIISRLALQLEASAYGHFALWKSLNLTFCILLSLFSLLFLLWFSLLLLLNFCDKRKAEKLWTLASHRPCTLRGQLQITTYFFLLFIASK